MFEFSLRARSGPRKPLPLESILTPPGVATPLPFAVGKPLAFAAIPHEIIDDERLLATDIRLVGVLLRR